MRVASIYREPAAFTTRKQLIRDGIFRRTVVQNSVTNRIWDGLCDKLI